jgi:hypothetical protein
LSETPLLTDKQRTIGYYKVDEDNDLIGQEMVVYGKEIVVAEIAR